MGIMSKMITVDGVEYEYLRNGCDNAGWKMSPYTFYRCSACGYLMNGDPSVSDTCICGKLYKDSDYGRFGSGLGDNAIEVYKPLRKS